MNNSLKKYILIFLLTLLFGSSWYLIEITLSGKTIFFSSELILYFILAYIILFFRKKIVFPKQLKRVSLVLILFGAVHIIFSLFFADFGQALLKFRSLIYFPIIGILTGSTFSKIIRSNYIFKKALYAYFYILLVWSVLNFIFNIKPIQRFGLINRFDGILISIIFFEFLRYIFIHKKIEFNLYYIFYILVPLILIFFTASRGIYISFIVAFLIMMYIYKNRIKSPFLFKIQVISLLFVGFFLLIYSKNYYRIRIDDHIDDFIEVYHGDFGSYGEKWNTIGGRFFLYKEAFKLGLKSPILGRGLGYKVGEFYISGPYNIYRKKTAHNYYLTIWYKTGILGIILFSWFIIHILKETKKKNISVFFFLIICYTYAAFDVMLAAFPPAILSIYFIIGFALSIKYDQVKKYPFSNIY